MITAYIDGSCAPANPGGKMGIGVLIYEDGIRKINHRAEFPPRRENTSNKAEYLALKCLLEFLKGKVNENITVYSDSTLLVTQMNKKAKINRGAYKPTALECREILGVLKKENTITFKWIPRERNTLADNLSKINLVN